MYIQLRLEETPAFRHLEEQQEGNETQQGSPVLEVIMSTPGRYCWRGCFLSSMGHSISSSGGILDYGTRTLGLFSDAMLAATDLLRDPDTGPSRLCRPAGPGRPAAGAPGRGGTPGAMGVPYVLAQNTRDIVLITLALSLGQIFLSMMYGPQAFSSPRCSAHGCAIPRELRWATRGRRFSPEDSHLSYRSVAGDDGTSLSVSFCILAMAVMNLRYRST